MGRQAPYVFGHDRGRRRGLSRADRGTSRRVGHLNDRSTWRTIGHLEGPRESGVKKVQAQNREARRNEVVIQGDNRRKGDIGACSLATRYILMCLVTEDGLQH